MQGFLVSCNGPLLRGSLRTPTGVYEEHIPFEQAYYITITISIMIICTQHNTFMLWQPLPCSPAAETAPQPLIWCSET